MPAVLKTLHDINNNIVFPETIITAVNMPDGSRTLFDELEEINDESSITVFNNDGTITRTMTHSGMIITTSFADGVITDECTYADGTPYYTKTTTFNSNGSITVSKIYADNT